MISEKQRESENKRSEEFTIMGMSIFVCLVMIICLSMYVGTGMRALAQAGRQAGRLLNG